MTDVCYKKLKIRDIYLFFTFLKARYYFRSLFEFDALVNSLAALNGIRAGSWGGQRGHLPRVAEFSGRPILKEILFIAWK